MDSVSYVGIDMLLILSSRTLNPELLFALMSVVVFFYEQVLISDDCFLSVLSPGRHQIIPVRVHIAYDLSMLSVS